MEGRKVDERRREKGVDNEIEGRNGGKDEADGFDDNRVRMKGAVADERHERGSR